MQRFLQMNNFRKISIATVVLALSACSNPAQKVTKDEAIALLNEGQVSAIGVSHSGWTILTLVDGKHVHNRAKKIGYPAQLLEACAECSNVGQWIE